MGEVKFPAITILNHTNQLLNEQKKTYRSGIGVYLCNEGGDIEIIHSTLIKQIGCFACISCRVLCKNIQILIIYHTIGATSDFIPSP